MNLLGLLGRLTSRFTGGRANRYCEGPTPAHEVTADVLYLGEKDGNPSVRQARLVYTTNPYYANDLVFISRLTQRLYHMMDVEPGEDGDVRLKALLTEPFENGQCRLLPRRFCECEPVYLHDVVWRDADAGPEFVFGDPNRSVRTMRLYQGSKEPELDPVLSGDGPRRARRRNHR
jgi:hypothetical protein